MLIRFNLQVMEDPIFMDHRHQILPLDNLLDDEFNFEFFSSDQSNSANPSLSPEEQKTIESSQAAGGIERPSKLFNTITPRTAPSSSSAQLISLGNSNIQKLDEDLDKKAKHKEEAASTDRYMKFGSSIPESSYENQKYSPISRDRTKRVCSTTTRNPLNNHGHIVAERQRREKLTQRFLALSALIPGLRKVLSVVKHY